MDDGVIAGVARAVASEPGNHALRSHLACLLAAADRGREAREQATKVLAEDPDNPVASSLLMALVDGAPGRQGTEPAERPGAEGSRVPPVVRPVRGLDEVAAPSEARADLRRLLVAPGRAPSLQRAFGSRPHVGVLLYGPPGCGQARLVRGVAAELDCAVKFVAATGVVGSDVEAEDRDAGAASWSEGVGVVAIEAVDAPGRRGDPEGLQDLQWLGHMIEGLRDDDVLVLGCTTRPWRVSPTLCTTGRLDRGVFVPPPDAALRRRVLGESLGGRPVADDVGLEALAAATAGCSIADLWHVVAGAADRAMAASIEHGDVRPITGAMLRHAAASVPRTGLAWVRAAVAYGRHAQDRGPPGLVERVGAWQRETGTF